MHSALYLKHNDTDDGCQFVMTLQRFSVVRSYFDLLISSFIICVLADAMVVTNDRAKAAASAKSLTFQTGVVESRGRARILQNITGAIMSQDSVLVLLATWMQL